jgi:Rps23 Pro-64 3,4-dihydroxylase Tpa1-like proline 4-hydroxylase
MSNNSMKETFLQWMVHDTKGLITLNPITAKSQMNSQQQAAQVFMLLHRHMDISVLRHLEEMLKLSKASMGEAKMRLFTEIDIIANPVAKKSSDDETYTYVVPKDKYNYNQKDK